MPASITLYELNQAVAASIYANPKTQNVWVTAELSDVSRRGGHCYMELLQKDDRGLQVAKARGVIWSNNFSLLERKFRIATGMEFGTGIKLMVKASATMHPLYGLSLVIVDLDPNYTMGDLLRRRAEIVKKLTEEGLINNNRETPWPDVPQRIAIISAPGAAGYGDFMNQLLHNPARLRFIPHLFPAIMQGNSAARSIIASLEEIAAQDCWDCVVIIRGGGATSDLQCFEDEDLARNIACFPLPVIIGIGHERDITLLDYVANMRVKTPTAAAEWLIDRSQQALDNVDQCAQLIISRANELIAGHKEQLAYYQGILPTLPRETVQRATLRLGRAAVALSGISAKSISPARAKLDVIAATVSNSIANAIKRQLSSLDATENLVKALSPEAVLARGYSITRVNGVAVTDAALLSEGTVIETTLADGTVSSVVTNCTNSKL